MSPWPPPPFSPTLLPQCDTSRLHHCVHSAHQGLCWRSHPAAVWCPPNIPQAFHSDQPLCNWPVLGERERRSLCPPSDHWRDRRCQPSVQSAGKREAISELTVLEYLECLHNEIKGLWYSSTYYTMSEAMLTASNSVVVQLSSFCCLVTNCANHLMTLLPQWFALCHHLYTFATYSSFLASVSCFVTLVVYISPSISQ